jgi:DNA-directed RNA polymerase specialized sigma24 family protein
MISNYLSWPQCVGAWSASLEWMHSTPHPFERNPQKKSFQMHNERELPADVFEAWFSRSRQTLQFLAYRVLACPDRAARAVGNCWLTASRNPPYFEQEGAFRSWLLRVLISEALTILHQSQKATRLNAFQQGPPPEEPDGN